MLAAIAKLETGGIDRAAGAGSCGRTRHVTVMFCDLVDSTGISAKLDAEEWRDLVGAYLDAASAAVTEMGGKVAKKLGDGLMALFGYPVAQENDAERAVRAALSIQLALAEAGGGSRASRSGLRVVYRGLRHAIGTRRRSCSMSWHHEAVVNREFQKFTLPATWPCVGSRDRCMVQESIWCELRVGTTGLGFPRRCPPSCPHADESKLFDFQNREVANDRRKAHSDSVHRTSTATAKKTRLRARYGHCARERIG
jgi:hypothetical protein